MGLIALVYSVGFFWIALHTLHYWLARRGHGTSSGTLPAPSSNQPGKRLSLDTKVILHQAYLRVESTRYNDAHDRLTVYLAKKSQATTRRILVFSYECGRIAGLIGMVLVVILLLASVTRSAVNLLGPTTGPTVGDAHFITRTFSKRDEDPPFTLGHSSHVSHAHAAPLHLIIPGVTVPLSHLPLLLGALFVTQVIHEAGHAICSAIESVPLLSTGASITILIPSAFVSLSSAAVQSLPPRARMRIIAAGPFHNLVYWILLALLLQMGIGRHLWYIVGYDYVGHFGRVVLGTHPSSPLHQSLPEGAVIISLDDIRLTSSDPSADLWTAYLSRADSFSADAEIGWCVDAKWFMTQNNACCATPHAGSNQACFVEIDPGSTVQLAKCAPTLAILHSESASVKRCTLTADCGDHRVCVGPRHDEELVRIGVWMPGSRDLAVQSDSTDSTVVIWSGPREEILEEVQVGVYLSQHFWLPLGPPEWAATFTNYLLTLTLSLYLFNLLPLPFLDGSQLLDAFLDSSTSKNTAASRSDIVMRDMEAGSGYRSADRIKDLSATNWRRRLSRGVQILTGTLMVMTILLRSLELRL